MNHLNCMMKAGFRVNWRTVLMGLDGPGKYPPLITLEDVLAFANEQLAVSPPPDGAVAIVVASSEDPTEVRVVLERLAQEERSDSARELRKWRHVLLEEAIAKLPDDAVHGLLALTEFWDGFDFPSDGPHVVQGRGNQVGPLEYFSEMNYRHLVRRHEEWLSREAEALGCRHDPAPLSERELS